VPPGTPTYPGLHNVGSRNWTANGERDPWPEIGEWEGRTKWSNGRAPDPMPEVRTVGSVSCIEEGEGPPCPAPLPDPGKVIVANCNSLLPDTVTLFFRQTSGLFAGLNGVSLELPRITPGLFGWELLSNNTYGLPGSQLRFTVGCNSGGVILWLQNPAIGSPWFLSPQVGWTTINPTEQLPLIYNNFNDLEAEVLDAPLQPQPTPYFPDECYVPLPKPVFQNAPGLLAGVNMIAKVYANDASVLTDLASYLGPMPTLNQWPDTGASPPGIAAGRDGNQAIAIVAGTTNFQQAAAQLAYGLLGPVNVGSFSTLLFWFTEALTLASRISSVGTTADQKVTLIGHSYGGALCAVLAAIYRVAQPQRHISVITYGMPRLGDERLRTILDTCRCQFIAGSGDPITAIPPTGNEVVPFVTVIPTPILTNWLSVVRPGSQVILDADGSLTDASAGISAFDVLLQVVDDLVAGDPLPFFAAHPIAEYQRRLELSVNA